MTKYIKVYELQVADVILHDLVHLTPMMSDQDYLALKASISNNGQEVPVTMYKGKCIDGRHRLKALADLGIAQVKAINEKSNMSEGDIMNKVLNVFERRRHQTPTQKCISALKQYNSLVLAGESPSKGVVATEAGVSRNSLYLAEQLLEVAGEKIIDHLFNGNKLNIGTETKPIITDSLKQLTNYYKSKTDDLLELSNTSVKTTSDYTEEELTLVADLIGNAKAQLPGRLLELYKQQVLISCTC
jgi:hypothetical protein